MIWGFGIDGMSAHIFPAPLRAGGAFPYFPIYCKIATERKQPIWMIRPKFKSLQAYLQAYLSRNFLMKYEKEHYKFKMVTKNLNEMLMIFLYFAQSLTTHRQSLSQITPNNNNAN